MDHDTSGTFISKNHEIVKNNTFIGGHVAFLSCDRKIFIKNKSKAYISKYNIQNFAVLYAILLFWKHSELFKLNQNTLFLISLPSRIAS
jgi:hypothetical protein